MKIQITPVKKVEEAISVWFEPGSEVDLVMDPRKKLDMRASSVKTIYAFNILGLAEPHEVVPMIKNFFDILEPEGELYIIEHDFDYINRAYLGGDLSLEEFNRDFRRKTYFNSIDIVTLLGSAGFPEKDQRSWFDGIQFKKEHYEVIVSAKKSKK